MIWTFPESSLVILSVDGTIGIDTPEPFPVIFVNKIFLDVFPASKGFLKCFLVSPYDGKNIASLMYCSPQKDKAVFYWWKLETFYNEHLPRVRMQGLDPDKSYRIHELNRIDNEALPYEGKVFSGKYLMENGLEMPLKHKVDYHKQNDWSSRVLYMTAE